MTYTCRYNRRTLISLLLIATAAMLAYSTTFSVPFVLDDVDSIVDNPVIKDLGSFLSGEGYAYNPRRFIGYLTFALNFHFGGLNVFGYHLVNLAIHIANGFLVYALASLALRASGERKTVNSERENLGSLLLPTPYSLIPLFSALLFVVHPVQTQAVTYIVQRLASLATLFYLGAVVCYAKGRHEALDPLGPKGSGLRGNNEVMPSRSPFTIHHSPVLWYFLALLSGLLALKTKEIAVTLPLAILLYEFSFFRASRRKMQFVLVMSLAGLLAAGIFLLQVLPDMEHFLEGFRAAPDTLSRQDYFITQLAVIATYLRLLIFPVGQNLDHDYPIYTSLAQIKPLLGLLLHLVLIGAAVYLLRKRKGEGQKGLSYSPFTIHYSLLSFGIFWFYLTLMVESSFIPIQDVINEHRLYLPSLGFVIAVAAGGALVARTMSKHVVVLVFAVSIIALAGGTWKRNLVWQTEQSLWEDAAAKSPGKPRVLVALGNLHDKKGDQDGALAFYSRALQINPNYYVAHFNLGIILLQRGMIDVALYHLTRARNLAPNDATIYYNLGLAYYKKGMINNSIPYFSRAVDLAPGNYEYRQALSQVLADFGSEIR